MSPVSEYFRGPDPYKPRRRWSKPKSVADEAAAFLAVVNPVSTWWKQLPAGRVLVNPNLCLVCHQGPHTDTPHHEFIPDEASEDDARRLGWPMPNTQEPLL